MKGIFLDSDPEKRKRIDCSVVNRKATQSIYEIVGMKERISLFWRD